MEKDRILEELYAQAFFGSKLGLENMEKMCELLGNPERGYRIIHLAGTNGKGSTATAIETVLLEAGYRVGKYTSPHILNFNERIKFQGEEISDEDIIKYYVLVKEIWKKAEISPTFFEITTMMMFKYFQDMDVDYVVLETGLGGRLDATNIACGDIAVITNVTPDHQDILGNTIYGIAKEKAGIIKPGSKVIVGDSNLEFLKAVEEKSSIYTDVLKKYEKSSYSLDYERFLTKISLGDREYEFSLFGSHQYKNFLCAYEVLKSLNISEENIEKGMRKVIWECRFEIYSKSPLTVLDGAHNIDGMKNLKKIIGEHYAPSDVVVITSILKDKEVKRMLELMSDFSEDIILTSLGGNSRGLEGKDILKLVEKDLEKFSVEEDMRVAYERAVEKNKKLILICGSFYLLSKFKEEFSK